MNQTESVAESRWGVGLEKLTGGFVKRDSERGEGRGESGGVHVLHTWKASELGRVVPAARYLGDRRSVHWEQVS